MDKKMTCTKAGQTILTSNFTALRSITKALIVWLAIHSCMPASVATALIKLGGLQND